MSGLEYSPRIRLCQYPFEAMKPQVRMWKDSLRLLDRKSKAPGFTPDAFNNYILNLNLLPLHKHRHHCSVVGIAILKGGGTLSQGHSRNNNARIPFGVEVTFWLFVTDGMPPHKGYHSLSYFCHDKKEPMISPAIAPITSESTPNLVNVLHRKSFTF